MYPNEYLIQCRACNNQVLTQLFSLGNQYVSDFVSKENIHKAPECPISLVLCDSCRLIQQTHTAPQDFMYSRHYWYRSGTTNTMRNALHDLVDEIQHRIKPNKGDIVLDIGSNDSTLLRSYRSGVTTVGVEPATNLQDEARVGIDYLINDFWSYKAYENFLIKEKFAHTWLSEQVRAKIITACGMFYDLPEPQKFINDVSRVLRHDGVFVAQLMCAKQMYDKKDVGNLAHEHLEFYTLKSLIRMLERAESPLQIFDIKENNVNGGSYQLWIKHESCTSYSVDSFKLGRHLWIESMLHDSNARFVWNDWYKSISENRDRAMKWITDQSLKGQKGMILGASTKGNVLLQWYGIDNRLIQYASERSPEKIGKFTVGTGIECISEEQARSMNPDYYIVLPYTFKDEIIQRERQFLYDGGKLLFLLPKAEIVTADGNGAVCTSL